MSDMRVWTNSSGLARSVRRPAPEETEAEDRGLARIALVASQGSTDRGVVCVLVGLNFDVFIFLTHHGVHWLHPPRET